MTQTLTAQAMQEIYEAAVHAEATGDDQDASFELLCKLEDIGGTGATIRKLIDMVRAANREAQAVAATPIYQIWDDDGWYDADERIWRDTYDDFCKNQYRIVYTAPPAPAVNPELTRAPVVPDERAAFNAWNNEDNLPIAGIPAKNAAWLAWQARAMLAAAPEGGN
jgi:hypothetical protein